MGKPPDTDDGGSPVANQKSFAGRGDGTSEGETAVNYKYADGTTGDTASNAKNRDWTETMGSGNIRARIRIEVEVTVAALADFHEILQYRKNGGTWTTITGSTNGCIYDASANYVHADDTTQQISSGTYISNNDGMNESSAGPGSTNRPDYTTTSTCEFEWCFSLVDADLSNGDTIEFRVLNNAALLNTYTQIPMITISKAGAGGTVSGGSSD